MDKSSYTRESSTFSGIYTFIAQDRWFNKTARFISNLCSPPIIALMAALVTALTINTESAWLWTLAYAGTAILLPTIYILILLKRGAISGFHLNERKERTKPLAVISINTALIFLIMVFAGAPKLILLIMATSIIQLLLILAITQRWKISGHCTAAASLAAYAIALYGTDLTPLALLVPLIAWSRIKLNRHSLAQTIAGTLLGAVTVTFMLYTTNAI